MAGMYTLLVFLFPSCSRKSRENGGGSARSTRNKVVLFLLYRGLVLSDRCNSVTLAPIGTQTSSHTYTHTLNASISQLSRFYFHFIRDCAIFATTQASEDSLDSSLTLCLRLQTKGFRVRYNTRRETAVDSHVDKLWTWKCALCPPRQPQYVRSAEKTCPEATWKRWTIVLTENDLTLCEIQIVRKLCHLYQCFTIATVCTVMYTWPGAMDIRHRSNILVS